ncbi:MAG: type VI secretion system-associated protein TagF [Pseudomonadota bacterium]
MTLGCYGKLPDRGDFVSRAVAPDLEEAAHRWGSSIISQGRDQHGEDFADLFANMPLYAVIAEAGALINRTAAGLFGPSTDAVGRLFPLFVLTDAPKTTEKVDPGGYTEAARVVDAAAFEKTPLTDVEEALATIDVTAPNDIEGIWLSQWSVNGPVGQSHRYSSLDQACASSLDLLVASGDPS